MKLPPYKLVPHNGLIPGGKWVGDVTKAVTALGEVQFDERFFSMERDGVGWRVTLRSSSSSTTTDVHEFTVREDKSYEPEEDSDGNAYARRVKVYPGHWDRICGHNPMSADTGGMTEMSDPAFLEAAPGELYGSSPKWCIGQVDIEAGDTVYIHAQIDEDTGTLPKTFTLTQDDERRGADYETGSEEEVYNHLTHVCLAKVTNTLGVLTIVQEHIGPIRDWYTIPDGEYPDDNLSSDDKVVYGLNWSTQEDEDGKHAGKLQDYRAWEELVDSQAIMQYPGDKVVITYEENDGKIVKNYRRIDSEDGTAQSSSKSIAIENNLLTVRGFAAGSPSFSPTSSTEISGSGDYLVLARKTGNPEMVYLALDQMEVYSSETAGTITGTIGCHQIDWDSDSDCAYDGPFWVTGDDRTDSTTSLKGALIMDNSDVHAIDITNRQLLRSPVTAPLYTPWVTLDWYAGCLYAQNRVASVSWTQWKLIDESGNTSINWELGHLKGKDGTVLLGWTTTWNANRLLSFPHGVNSNLTEGTLSLDTELRILYGADGTTKVFDWSTLNGSTLSNSLRVTGAAPTVMTGSINPSASTTVTGTATEFRTELTVGDRITVSGETRTVTAINSDTELIVDTAFSDTAEDVSVDKLSSILVARDSNGINKFVVKDTGDVEGTGEGKFLTLKAGNATTSAYLEIVNTRMIWRPSSTMMIQGGIYASPSAGSNFSWINLSKDETASQGYQFVMNQDYSQGMWIQSFGNMTNPHVIYSMPTCITSGQFFGQLTTYNSYSTDLSSGLLPSSGDIRLLGTDVRSIRMGNPVLNKTAGKSLTIVAGNILAGGTNQAGGDLLLEGGMSGGSASSNVWFYTATGGTSGTTTHSPTAKWKIDGVGNFISSLDSTGIVLGAASDASMKFNGSGLVIASNLVTATDYLQLIGGTNGIDLVIGATEQVTLTDGKFAPTTDSDIDLGDSTHFFKEAFMGKLTTNGGRIGKITTANDTYTVLVSDDTVICDKSSSFTISLPVAVTGQKFTIKNVGAGVVTVDADSSDTIDGSLTQSVNQWESMQIQCYAANKWAVL